MLNQTGGVLRQADLTSEMEGGWATRKINQQEALIPSGSTVSGIEETTYK